MSSQLGKWLQQYSQSQPQSDEGDYMTRATEDGYGERTASSSINHTRTPIFPPFSFEKDSDEEDSDQEQIDVVDEGLIGRVGNKKEKKLNHYRNLAALPHKFVRHLPLYKDAPELKYTLRTHPGGASSTMFIPSMPTYYHFAQHEGPLANTEKQLLHEIFQRSFYCGDNEMAAKALFAYGCIAPLEFPDLVALTEMILQSDSSSHDLVQSLVRAAPTLLPPKLQGQTREDFINVLVQSLTYVGEIQQTKEILRNKLVIGDAQGRTSVAMTKALIAMFQVAQYANSVYQLVDKNNAVFADIPEMLVARPAEFLWAVFLLYSIVSAEDDLKSKITERVRQECQRKLEELRMVFAESAMGVKAESNLYLEYHTLYLAYLIGIDQTASAARHLDYLLRWYDDNAVDSSVVGRLYHLLQGLVSFQAPLDASYSSSESVDVIASDALQLRLKSMYVHPADSIYLMVVLFKHRVIPAQTIASQLADFLESYCAEKSIDSADEPGRREIEWFNAEQWLLWETLAASLGKVEVVADNAPLHASCGLNTCNYSMVALKENPFDFPFLNLSQFTIPADFHPNVDEPLGWKAKFKEDYGWWVESILCASNLGEFCIPALPSTAHEMMNELQEVSPLRSISSLLQIPKLAKANDWFRENLGYAAKVNSIYDGEGDLLVPDWINLSASPSEESIRDKLSMGEILRVLSLADNTSSIPQIALTHAFRGQETADLFIVDQIRITNPLLLAGLPSAEQVPDDSPALRLGLGILEVLTWQALVAAHLASTDHFFVLRVVQLLVQHAFMEDMDATSAKAKQCLRYLDDQGCNIRRCYELSVECFYRVRSTLMAAPNVQAYDNMDDVQDLGLAYQPVPFT